MKNQSDYFVHAQKDGVTHSFGPGEDIPSWVHVDNPYVTGKKTESEDEPVESEDDEAPRRGRPRKAADGA